MSAEPAAMTVLHVDDDEDFIALTAELLGRQSDRITVISATEASEALDLLEREDVDCVVSDYEMSETDGLELLAAVRERHGELPFILFTGRGSEEIASEAISAGVTDYLQKGTGSEQYAILANRIGNAVSARRSADEAERRRQRLEETTARLEVLFEDSPDMINIHDADGTIIDPNPRLCEQTGYDASELSEMKVWDVDHTVDPEDVKALWEEMEPGDCHRVDSEYQRKDGSTFPVEIHLRRLDLEAKDWFVAISRDITARLERERELQRAREEYEALINGMNDTAWVIDTDETILDVNDAAVETIGYTREELRSMTPHEFDAELEPDELSDLITNMPVDGIQVFETVHETKDGDRIPVEISSSLVPYRGDTVVLSIARDISDRKQREKQLERFASIVSHDLRNPLNVAQGRLELAREVCDSEHLDHVAHAHDRMAVLIEDLLALAHGGAGIGDVEPVALESVCTTSWQHVATADAILHIETDRTIRADRSRVAQLLENLFRNAVEHGDAVSVTVGDRPNGFYVADDGSGIPEDERDDVFHAGYSTAEAGTGFGLSIVERVADAHGWTVHLSDSDHGGARFDIVGLDFID